MKNISKKLIAGITLATMLLTMVLGLASCAPSDSPDNGDGGGNTGPVVQAPEPKKEVVSVSIKYNNVTESDGYINVDLSAGSIDLTAAVRVSNDCEYSLTFASSDPAVAEVTNEGKVTLKSAGEAVITASAGGKSHSVVLLVSNNAKGEYSVAVEGGSADVTKAAVGDTVTLTVNASKKQLFEGWKFLDAETGEPIEDIWVNGNTFRMPAQNILVKAEFDVKTYALKVADATLKNVTNADTEVTAGRTVDGVTTYYVPADAEVTLVRNAEPDGETFVGWDSVNQGNRKAGACDEEYSFTMPEEDLSVFAVFSTTKSLTFGQFILNGITSGTQTAISSGVIGESESADEDLQGMNGYSFSFSAASVGSSAELPENTTGVNRFTTLGDGSQTVKIIYKNHSNYDLKLEFYASQFATIATTGIVTVPANSVTETVLVANYGFHNPAFNFVLREAVGGTSNETVQLDMVWELADTYPYGDNSFDVLEAKYVELYSDPSASDYPANSGIRNNVYRTGPIAGEFGGASVDKGSWGGRKHVNNENGISNIITRDKYTNTSGGTRYIYAKISNLPDYDADDSTVTVYFRFINTNSYSYKLSFGLGKSTDVNNDTTRVSYELDVEAYGTKLFGITIDREEADDIYFSIQNLSSKASNEYNFVVQMMYNNRIGVKPEDIVSAEE